MKPKSRWSDAHVRLKRIYEERVPEGMTQKEFGRLHGIGTQSFVAQLLNGIRPLNYELAGKFARALHCTIYDICPEMDAAVRNELVPYLGKALRRAAVLLLALATISFQDESRAAAEILHNRISQYTLFAWLSRFLNNLFKRPDLQTSQHE